MTGQGRADRVGVHAHWDERNSYAEETTGYSSYGLPEGETVKATGGTFAGTLADHRRSTGASTFPKRT